MSVVRAFIAIDLPRDLQRCLQQISFELKQRLDDLPVRWVPIANIHLTLKFLGDVSENNIEMLAKIMQKVISGHRAFAVSAGGFGAFPKIHAPRIIWVGLECPPELSAIQREIEAETARLGYASEERPFSPHLTLGRVYRNATSGEIRKIAKVLGDFKVGFLGVAHVREVHLFRSELKTGGAVYSRLFTARLPD